MMITVTEAEQIIQLQQKDYGTEVVLFDKVLGRILAEDILADRDLPPCNRVTMDGIAITFKALEAGIRSFNIIATQAAGDSPVNIKGQNECIEIMTGAALPETTDTIIRYEDIQIQDKQANMLINANEIKRSQNIHPKGIDKKQHEIIMTANHVLTPAEISMLASLGKTTVIVKKNPKVVIISTGGELVRIDELPTPWQVRTSNSVTMSAALKQHGVASTILHLRDEPVLIEETLKQCLHDYDVILLSGGVSMGKFDHIPEILDKLLVHRLFHKVQQRPGKPFWFGKHIKGTLVFAFPGNPVSTFMCLYRYFLPWLNLSLLEGAQMKLYAVLESDFTFTPALQYFLLVKLSMNNLGQLLAAPVEGHGSGDFANLTNADAFMELPLEQSNFKKGDVYPIWPFKQII